MDYNTLSAGSGRHQRNTIVLPSQFPYDDTMDTPAGEVSQGGEGPLLPRPVVAVTAFICAAVLVALVALGPLFTGTIEYRTSESAVFQTEGQDLANLFVITPILLLGGVLHLMRREGAKYLLVLPPITLMYVGISYGIGQEWSDPSYTGNVENYAWLFLVLVIGGLLLLVGALSLFAPSDAPEFGKKGLRVYVALMAIFLLVFAMMWLSELVEVMSTGGTESGNYESTPTLWWTIRFLDLGVTIPLGYLALFLLLSNPRRSYPLVLLFFGFFVTMGTAVCAMGWIMYFNDDPEMQSASLVVFTSLAMLSYAGLLYMVKEKLPWAAASKSPSS